MHLLSSFLNVSKYTACHIDIVMSATMFLIMCRASCACCALVRSINYMTCMFWDMPSSVYSSFLTERALNQILHVVLLSFACRLTFASVVTSTFINCSAVVIFCNNCDVQPRPSLFMSIALVLNSTKRCQ